MRAGDIYVQASVTTSSQCSIYSSFNIDDDDDDDDKYHSVKVLASLIALEMLRKSERISLLKVHKFMK